MPISLSVRHRAKLVAGTAACAVAATVLSLASPAIAATTTPIRAMIETGTFSADPVNAITTGWWGHEGVGRNGNSIFSLDGKGSAAATTSATIAAQLAKIGPDATLDNLHVAFVLTSADGSAEKPAVTAGENVGHAFTWFNAATVGSSSESGNNQSNDYVDALSTETSYNAWFAAGQLTYGFDDNLVAHDATQPGNPVSGAHAIGTSILNTWPAGTKVSMVYYVSTSVDGNNEPIVTVGPDGHAETAWMPFTTVALPTDHTRDPVGTSFPASYDTVRTSGGYAIAAAAPPTVHISDSWSGAAGTVHAALTNASNVALSDATGTIQFSARAVDATGGTFTNVGSPVAVSATGTASMPISGLTSGHFQEYEATYTPDDAASATYTAATSGIDQIFAPAATTTSVAVSGTLRYPYQQGFSATVTSGGGTPTGTVTFLDHGVSIGTAGLVSGHASFSKALSIGSHSITARYEGGSGFSTSTSAAKAVTVAKGSPVITPSISPAASRIKHGTRPKLTVTVKATGLSVTGTLTIVIVAPNHHKTTIKVKLTSGKATITLPKVLRGTTKVTISYSGSSTVAAGSKAYSFKVSH